MLEESDVHLGACVVDSTAGKPDPFKSGEAEWIVHARITAQLIVGLTNRRELVGALLDGRSTPAGKAFDDTVRSMVNKRLKATSLVSAVCVDSCTNDGVQLADLVAGAVAHQRRTPRTGTQSHKAKIASRLAATFGLPDLGDVRTSRINIMTHGSRTGNESRTLRAAVPVTKIEEAS